MHSADISAALKKAGSSQVEIAATCGISQQSVGKVLRGMSRSAKIEKAISEATQLPLHVLWPKFYSGTGAPEPKPSMGLAPNPLASLLLAEFSKMDLAQQARLLQVAVELTSGANIGAQFAKAVADLEAQSSTAHFAKMQAAKDAQTHAGLVKALAELEAYSSTANFAKMQNAQEAKNRAEYGALHNQPVPPPATPTISIKSKNKGVQTNNFFKKE